MPLVTSRAVSQEWNDKSSHLGPLSTILWYIRHFAVGCGGEPLTPVLRRQRQVIGQFKVSLFYIVSSRPARATR